MDIFFEQIVSIKKNLMQVCTVVLLWFAAALVTVTCFFFPIFGAFTLLLAVGAIYAAFKLSGSFNIEYEYIITNGTMDIDKIINKSSRKREVSFELSDVSRIEEYTPALLKNIDPKKILFSCNADDSNAYFMVVKTSGGSSYYIVFSPDEYIKSAIVKYIPKFVLNNIF